MRPRRNRLGRLGDCDDSGVSGLGFNEAEAQSPRKGAEDARELQAMRELQ